MIDFLLNSWNDTLTILAFIIALVTGVYQVQHYRALSPNLKIISITTADYSQDPSKDEEGTRYELEVRTRNKGREATTIVDGSLFIHRTDEELDLQRYEGSTTVPIAGDSPPNLPSPVDSEKRVAGNDVANIKFRTTGRPQSDYSTPVKATISLRTVDGGTCSKSFNFTPRESS